MSNKTSMLLAAAAGAALAASAAVAQTPAAPSLKSAAAPAPPPAQTFPTGAEVLSVEGEALGVLAQVELRPGGERVLHIRRPDGSVTTAPAVMASRGERAVVLEWTREEFETGAAVGGTNQDDAAASPAPPTI